MYTYTAVQLPAKTFGELKSIASEFYIVPSRDRRCRQSWIDALVGVNPPLLQLLEVSPAAEEVELALSGDRTSGQNQKTNPEADRTSTSRPANHQSSQHAHLLARIRCTLQVPPVCYLGKT